MFAAAGRPQPNTLPATTLSTEPYSSITVVSSLQEALNLDTHRNCLFLSKDGELRTECRKVEFSTGWR